MTKMIVVALIVVFVSACGSTKLVEHVRKGDEGYTIYLQKDGKYEVDVYKYLPRGSIRASAKNLPNLSEARAFALRTLECGIQCATPAPQKSSAAPPKARHNKETSGTQCPARLPFKGLNCFKSLKGK